MKFCKNCSNMYYLSVSEENPDIITFYCRNCGDTESNTEMICIYKSSSEETNEVNENVINRYTKLDPTLPRIHKIPCPKEDCPTHTEHIPNEVILIRYDNSNMKYLYLCSICDYSWKSDV